MALFPILLKGDLLEMTNGDRYVGNVVSVTQTNVTFQSEIQGTMSLPRSKVARISFGETAGRTPAVDPRVPPSSLKTNETLKPVVDPKVLSQVPQDLLSTTSPEARRQFNETVKGLVTGRLTIDDIRSQARDSVNQIKAAKEELGEDAGGLLDGYLHILERFLQENDKPVAAPAVPTPKATNSPAVPTPQK